MEPAVAIVQLPCSRGSNDPLLRRRQAHLRDKTLSVRLADCEGALDQLPQLLATQRPEAVVVSSRTVLRGRHVQRIAAAAFPHCRTVSIVASDRGVDWYDAVAVRVHGAVRSFCLLDAGSGGGELVLFGNLSQLGCLTVTGACHVHLAGQVLPGADFCIQGRSLDINGVPMAAWGPSRQDAVYIWSTSRMRPAYAWQPPQPPRPLMHPSQQPPKQPPKQPSQQPSKQPPEQDAAPPPPPPSPQSSPAKLVHPRPQRPLSAHAIRRLCASPV